MNFFSDFLITSKMALIKSVGLIKKAPGILLLGIPYVILFELGSFLASKGGFLEGLVLFLIECALISSYLYYIHEGVNYGKIDISLFSHSFAPYFSKVMGVLFIIWVAQLLLNLVLMPFNMLGAFFSVLLLLLVKLAIFSLLNGVPETIYQKHYNEPETLLYAIRFVRENIINWLLPNFIAALLVWMIFNAVLSAFPIGITAGSVGLMASVVASILISPVMVFRGALFEILSTSSRRKRYFMRDMYH